MWYEEAVCIIVFIVSIWSDSPLCFVDDLCQILGMFSFNSIGCNKVRSCWHSGGKYNRQMYVRLTLKSSYRKIWSNILTARWRASAWSDKMNKEQSADDPSVDLIRVKNMLNSTISMSYPDVVIACIEYKVFWKHSEQLRQRWWSTIHMKDYSLWWLTDYHNC